MKKVFPKTHLATRIEDYIRHKRNDQGLNFRVERSILYAYDNFCDREGLADAMLCETTFERYARSGTVTLCQSGKRYRTLFGFYEYCRTRDPSLKPIHPQVISAKSHRHTCYVYTDEDIARLMDFPNVHRKWNRRTSVKWQLWIGLLVTTGCRIGELANLKVEDVDFTERTLKIIGTKFHKDRLIPVDGTVIDAIRKYLAVRLHADSPYLFTGQKGGRWRTASMNQLFNKTLRELGIGGGDGPKPRVHDFRHTFAVRKVVEWHRSGVDVQSMLPALSTYMGHVHYADTTYYLESSSELLRAASERFHLIRED